MNISATIDDQEINDLLERVQARVGDMKPLMTRIGAFYVRSVQENFENESAPDGTAWQKLSQTTLLMGLAKNKGWKPVLGGLSARGKRYLQGKRILYESGDLMGSIHFQADESSVTIGSSGSIKYAAIHQFGGPAGRGKKVEIPARPYLAMNEGEELVLAEKDRAWIIDLIKEEMQSWS